jgi:hypothetical protein
MRCKSCAWFRRPRGRTPTTCRDVGEAADNEACAQFEVDAPEPAPPTPAELVGALSRERFSDMFHEILAESFVLEQDARVAVDTIRAQLQTQGANITLDPGRFERQSGRLVDLYVLYRLVNVVGLARYADRIIETEIDRMWRDADEKPRRTRVAPR